jgi:serine/threonine protein kinase
MAKVFTITEGLENLGALKTGGQGSVYKTKRKGDIITAVKLLPTPIHEETLADKNFAAFQNEVQKLRKVNEQPNPHVVKFVGSGITESGSLPYIEMEFIEGPDLEDLLKPPHEPIFTIKEVLKVAFQLSHALEHCHKLDVRHGDIKSNNVKFNIKSESYILLDFGLAVMSDEQRRTSLRHAGAVEFMAPEQNDGQMLFQTDVYSFGVILYELLAGRVPFPLTDQGENARNIVRLAHLESSPPDLIKLREQSLPAKWSDEKKAGEMQVPTWLTSMIYKCIEKKPENRFSDGGQLHQFIVANSKTETGDDNRERLIRRLTILEQEHDRLLRENERLQRSLHGNKDVTGIARPTETIAERIKIERELPAVEQAPRHNSSAWLKWVLLFLLIVCSIAALVYYLTNPQTTTAVSTAGAEYKVLAERAYFHDEAKTSTRRNAYATPSNLIIKSQQEKNGFIYTEVTNDRGSRSKGWLLKEDLIPLKDWKRLAKNTHSKEVATQLKDARSLMSEGRLQEAFILYSLLVQKDVPEAQFEYANLALKNVNKNLDCAQAFDLMLKAANKDYAPAKTTIGFLYTYANDTAALKSRNYFDRCTFTQNIAKGSKYLMEATLAGDTAANRMLNQVNRSGR